MSGLPSKQTSAERIDRRGSLAKSRATATPGWRRPGIGQFAVIQSVAQPLGVELRPINALDRAEIERGIEAFARSPNGGLIVTVGGTGFHRDLIVRLAARHR